jgi:hypothetical protein
MRRPVINILFTGLALVLSVFSSVLYAQDRCGTVEYEKSLHGNPTLRKVGFERWLTTMSGHRLNKQGRQQVAPYQIPVVVHIIHNGEPIGVGPNITDAQVLSQLRVLNEDFRRENADAVNTPPEFLSLAGSLDIEFVLAKQDEEGQATTGIVRVNGGRTSWTMNDNYTLKSLSYWPAEQYMNIWVCNLTSHLGYAQFPESDLPGLENSSTNRLTDGIVIWHKAFGSIDDGAFNLDTRFDKGRTTTHETGHFFGLNHIWGDDVGCAQSDYVSDTPNQANQTDGCPAHPRSDACTEVVMFQNFLDYSDDDCMNLFTKGQVDRMVTVIENSPRRASLLTSPGLKEPDPVPNDLGIRAIVFPDASVCSNFIIPVIEVRNYGSNAVTSARIRFVLDGAIVETKDFMLDLGIFESAQIAFSGLTVPSGSHNILFQILLTNGGTDGGSYNDQRSATVIVPTFGDVPLAEDFNTPPDGWIVHNPDGQITWQVATAPNEMPTNKALKLNYYDYEDKIGEIDIFLSPVLDLSAVAALTLTFDVSHAPYEASNDRLRVVVLTDCQDYTEGTVVYDKAGDALKTTPSTTSPFTPSNQTQWRKELKDLSQFIGSNRVQLAFVGINDYGNNIYVDNITLFTDETRDIALMRLISPSVVTCTDEIAPSILIQNAGSLLLDDVTVGYAVNGGPVQSFTVGDLNLSFGGEKEIALPVINLNDGLNTLRVALADPQGNVDVNPDNNEKEFPIVVNKSEDRIPLRENFEDPFSPAWTAINPTGGMNWQLSDTNFGESLYFNAYSNTEFGDEAWFVSPVLDFSSTNQASMVFDVSYAIRNGSQETLTILASTDCGNTYKEISYNFFSPSSESASWFPADEDDWKTIQVNLNSVAGEEDVRIAFVIRNGNGNNLFLDNIEFFVTADPTLIDIEDVYSIYGYDLSNPALTDLRITFNLTERQDVRYSVISATGQMETDGIIRDVLNQTYPLNLPARLPAGVYFIRVHIGGRYYTSKVLVF